MIQAPNNSGKSQLISLLLCTSLVCSLCFASAFTHASEITTLRLSCLADRHSQAGRFLAQLYNRALEPLGYRVEMVNGDPQELIGLLRRGEVDGTCARDLRFSELTGITHLIPLEYSSITTTIYAVRRKRAELSADTQNLKLGYLPALKRSAELFENLNYKAILPYASTQSLLAGLTMGEVDLAALPDGMYANYRQRHEADDLTIHEVMFTQPGYAHLNRKHEQLVKPLSRRLVTVSAQGESYHVNLNKFAPLKNAETIVFGCATKANGETQQRFELLATKAFQNMGYNLKVVHLSRLRERTELEQGRIDGSCAKSRYYVDNVSDNTVLVEAPLTRDSIDIFSANASKKINSISDFDPSDRIAIVQSTYVVRPDIAPLTDRLIEVNSIEQGLSMLADGELDYFIDFKFAVIEHLDQIPLKNPIYTAGHLSDPVFYPALHKKHQALVPALTAELRKLIAANGQKDMMDH